MIDDLPLIRSGERADYKRCAKKWYWAWRRGLVPRNKTFGALDLGTWMHAALADWYSLPGNQRGRVDYPTLVELFVPIAETDIEWATKDGAPDHIIEKAEELAELGKIMADAYQNYYGADSDLYILATELPLEFSIPHPDNPSQIIAVHKLKPDAVFADANGDIWLLETKTAKQISTEHLVIDDQARPYGAMAERGLRELGIVDSKHQFKGILYNFLRKALPDERPQNEKGQYLNQNGSVSKKQPPPIFVRQPIYMSRQAKIITLKRVQAETKVITNVTLMLRKEPHLAAALPKTPHKSCPRFCQFFSMCVAEEEGGNIRDMERMMYTRRNPYLYEEETTEEPIGFEIG